REGDAGSAQGRQLVAAFGDQGVVVTHFDFLGAAKATGPPSGGRAGPASLALRGERLPSLEF
ncbi:MAG: hypothetical protein KGJ30_10635, partial [Burkholderiales bacterium]|nr:hypothetical protein [Burkholderiales bacterium]